MKYARKISDFVRSHRVYFDDYWAGINSETSKIKEIGAVAARDQFNNQYPPGEKQDHVGMKEYFHAKGRLVALLEVL